MRGTSTKHQRAGWYLVLPVALVGACLWIGFIAFTRSTFEDALITYRYAANLASGNGFVFNPGERVLGTTSPLLTVILALAGRVFGVSAIPVASTILMTAAGWATGILTWSLLRRLGLSSAWATVGSLFFYLHPAILASCVSGMEMPLVLLLMATSLLAFVAGRFRLGVVALGLLVLTRIDGLIWTVCLLLAFCKGERRPGLKDVVVLLSVLAPWFVFATLYFGNPLPHSIVAKSVMGIGMAGSGRNGPSSLAEYLQWFGDQTAIHATEITFSVWGLVCLLGILGVLAWRRRELIGPFMIFPVVFPLVFYFGGAPLVFTWHMIPLTWVMLVLGTIGVARFGEMLIQHAQRQQLPHALAASVCAGVAALLVVTLALADGTAFRHWQQWRLDEPTRRQIGEYLHATSPADATVAMEAIGYLGYYSERRVIDLAGWVSPQVVEAYRDTSSGADAFHRVLAELAPDYLVLRSFEVDENRSAFGGLLFDSPAQRDYFFARYREDRRFVAPTQPRWGKFGVLTVWKKQ